MLPAADACNRVLCFLTIINWMSSRYDELNKLHEENVKPLQKTFYFYTLHPVSILESCRNGAKFNYPAAKSHVECIIAHSTIYTYNILSLVSPPMGHVFFYFNEMIHQKLPEFFFIHLYLFIYHSATIYDISVACNLRSLQHTLSMEIQTLCRQNYAHND